MKLISNKPYESLFVYSPEIPDVNGWSETSPAVYKPSTGYIIQDTAFRNFSSPPKFFVFRALGGIDYAMYSVNGVHADVFLYDYLDYSSDDVAEKANSIVNGRLTDESTVIVREENTMVFLVAVFPIENDYDSLGTPITVSFSNQPSEVEYSSHYVRDWKNRIDGTCWNVSGKVNSSKRLADIGRRHDEGTAVIEPWKHGVYEKTLPCDRKVGDEDGFMYYFDDSDDVTDFDEGIRFSFDMRQEPHADGFIVRKASLVSGLEEGTAVFELAGNGEALIRMNGSSHYADFGSSSRSYATFSVHGGYNRMDVFYNSPKTGSENPYFSIKISGEVSSHEIPDDCLFLMNDCDIDKYISFDSILEGTGAERHYTSGTAILPGSSVSFPFSSTDGMTIGMRVMLPSGYSGTGCLFHGRGIVLYRNGENTVVLSRNGHDITSFQVECGVWSSIFLCFDSGIMSWYHDMNENGIANCDASASESRYYFGLSQNDEEYESIHMEGCGFELRNVLLAGKVFRYNEVNRFYQNEL